MKSSHLKSLGKNLYEFSEQYFYGEPVHIYLIEQENVLIIIDGPDASKPTIDLLQSFNKPLLFLITHGPCTRGIGNIAKVLPSKVMMYKEDFGNPWLTLPTSMIEPFPRSPYEITKDLVAIHTPGHSKGHACYFFSSDNNYLFTGDAVQGTKDGNVLDIFNSGTDWNTKKNIESLTHLMQNYKFDTILPFHYEIIWENARKKLIQELGKIGH